MAAADADRIAALLSHITTTIPRPQLAIDAMVKVLAWIIVRNAVDDRVDLLTQDVVTELRAAIKSAHRYTKTLDMTKPAKRPTPTLN